MLSCVELSDFKSYLIGTISIRPRILNIVCFEMNFQSGYWSSPNTNLSFRTRLWSDPIDSSPIFFLVEHTKWGKNDLLYHFNTTELYWKNIYFQYISKEFNKLKGYFPFNTLQCRSKFSFLQIRSCCCCCCCSLQRIQLVLYPLN